jgi:hypothetical protein
MEKIGKVLLLSDGLSTWIMSSYHSQIIDDVLVDKYLRVDRITKAYLRKKMENPSGYVLDILILNLRKIWEELLEAHAILDIPIPNGISLTYDLKQRVSVFKNYGVKDFIYV